MILGLSRKAAPFSQEGELPQLEKYTVVRDHEGDRPYAVGDEREAIASEVAHLVPHVLKPVEAKSDDAAEPKARKAAKGAPAPSEGE